MLPENMIFSHKIRSLQYIERGMMEAMEALVLVSGHVEEELLIRNE